MNELFDVKGKVAIVTGASQGIGAAIAQALARFGATVVVSSRKQEAVDTVAAKIVGSGGHATACAANVGRPEDLDRLIAHTIEHHDAIDILVNNAATNPIFGPVLSADSRAFDKVIEVNLKAPFELAKRVHPHLVKRGGGSIINIASIGGLSPEPGIGIYNVSKAALISLTKVLAAEWGGNNIRVNVICPGLIKTKFSAALWQDEARQARFTRDLPLARLGESDDVAGIAVFLASPASAYCTGGTYVVDGGKTL